MNRKLIYTIVIALLLVSLAPTASAAVDRQADRAQHPAFKPAGKPPAASTFTFALAPNGLSDISIPLDVSAHIKDAESLAAFIETQGGAARGSVQQLLRWDVARQIFLAWSHEFGYGDNFEVKLGDVILLTSQGGPTSVTFAGREPKPGEVRYELAAATSDAECALNFVSLPLDQGQITDADQLSDAIGGVVQALDWDATSQMFLAWSNEYNYGDNFPVKPGYPYLVCLDTTAPQVWP